MVDFNIFFKSLITEISNEIPFLPPDGPHTNYWRFFFIVVFFSSLFLIINFGLKGMFAELKTKIFNRKLILHPSSVLDVKILAFNAVFKGLIAGPELAIGLALAAYMIKFLRYLTPEFHGFDLHPYLGLTLFIVIGFSVQDFFKFYFHYLLHRNKFLRHFHRTHHSAQVLVPWTIMRAHPMETLFYQVRIVLATAVSSSLAIYLLPEIITGWDIIKYKIFGVFFTVAGGYFRHSQVVGSLGVLEYFIMSPRMHQVHHSTDKNLFNKNLGVNFSIWDMMFGTLYIPKKGEVIDYGFPGASDEESRNLKDAILVPFKMALKK